VVAEWAAAKVKVGSKRTWTGLVEEGGFLSGRTVAGWCVVERFFGRAVSVSVLVGRVGCAHVSGTFKFHWREMMFPRQGQSRTA
jgi:hypothetical protein